jgi:hypothetical protein
MTASVPRAPTVGAAGVFVGGDPARCIERPGDWSLNRRAGDVTRLSQRVAGRTLAANGTYPFRVPREG